MTVVLCQSLTDPTTTRDEYMKENISGRVARMNLKAGNALYPLFEAVSNSIDAIEALHGDLSAGRIIIELLRDTTQDQLDMEADRVDPIRAIRVTDNGIGFTAENFAAFDEADTEYKLELGGKGVGRFTWLRVFTLTSVDSTYRTGAERRKRSFTFSLPNGIENHIDRPTTQSETGPVGTSITMETPKPPYQQELRYRASTVAAALVRHFLSYLIADSAPQIEIIDGDTTTVVTAADITARTRTQFQINGQMFTIEHLRVQSPKNPQHAAIYCARRRAVKEERLKHLPEGRLRDGDNTFYYQAYVTSPYLDTAANELRTGFDIDDDQTDLAGVSLNAIRDQVKDAASGYLAEPLLALTADRDNRVKRVIAERVPDLAYVQDENADELKASIPLGATDAAVEEAIGAIHLRNQRAGRELLSGLVSELHGATTLNLAAFESSLKDRIERITKPSQASLASYMLYRRSIIDIYRELMNKSGDRFQREAAIHKLLFPMGAELDSATHLDHNLWLLDERLTFADYIASDMPLNQHGALFAVESKDEPDIACYFNMGFSEDDPAEGDLKNVVIVELKRPGPVASKPESPWTQVIRYIGDIREGRWSEGGRKIKASSNTRFYCYIVCDLDNPTIDLMRLSHQFKPIFDGAGGYYLYHDDLKAYAELVPFERVLRDAERKHRAFFARLGLPR
ncbi:MAG: ATP-binding protein [Acidobacteriota bacterium]